MLDIQGGARPLASAAQAPPTRPVSAAPVQGGAAPAPEARPKIAPIERPDIKVDTEGDQKRLDQAINRLNERMKDGGRGLNFRHDPALGRPVVTVTNQETGEVIRQIPNEVVIRIAHNLEDGKGMLLNAKV